MFVDFVVDAARRDPKQAGHVRVLTVGLVQRGFEAQPFALMEGAGEVPAVQVQEAYHRGGQILR